MLALFFSRACARFSDFLDSSQLLTQKLLEQDCGARRLSQCYKKNPRFSSHHGLVDSYEIAISHMAIQLFRFTSIVFLYHRQVNCVLLIFLAFYIIFMSPPLSDWDIQCYPCPPFRNSEIKQLSPRFLSRYASRY